MTKVYLGVSVGRFYEPDFVHCLLALLAHANVTFQPVVGDALIERSRARAATRFLEQSDADVFLTIDTDIVFRAEDALAICDQAMAYDMVAGAYWTRSRSQCIPSSHFRLNEPVEFGSDPAPVPIVWAATGFLATHRRVLERLAQRPDMPVCHASGRMRHRPFYLPFVAPNDDGEDILLSEDWAFCERARQEGFTVHLNPAVRLLHLGLHPFRGEDAAQAPLPEQPFRVTRIGGAAYRTETFEIQPQPDAALAVVA